MTKRRDFLKTSAMLGAYGLLHKWASAMPDPYAGGLRIITQMGFCYA